MSVAEPHFEPAAVLAKAAHETDCLPHSRANTNWSDEHMRAHQQWARRFYTAVKHQKHRLVGSEDRLSEDVYADEHAEVVS